jgi:hypothetical protein
MQTDAPEGAKTTPVGEIDISRLNKAEVLSALFNASKQQGMGIFHTRGASGMTVAQAQEELDALGDDPYFDYLHGRIMKVRLRGPTMRVWAYDRDNGPGAAERALAPLIAKAEGGPTA